jgi:DNA-binding NtrC family response regulator
MPAPIEKPKLVVISDDRRLHQEVSVLISTWYTVVPIEDPTSLPEFMRRDSAVLAAIVENSVRRAAGFDVLEFLRSDWPDVCRVLLTSLSELASAIDGLHRGIVQQVLYRPVSRIDLAKAVLPALSRRKTADASNPATATGDIAGTAGRAAMPRPVAGA